MTEIELIRNQLAEAQREIEQLKTSNKSLETRGNFAIDGYQERNAIIEYRNEIEGKANALFTEALSNGVRLAHYPEQCNPLGFVQVMRAAIEKLLRGEQLSNPFIHKPK